MEWSGPASVIGQQGKVIFLRYGNNLRRVHKSKVIRVGEEYKSRSKDKPDEHKTEKKAKDEDTLIDTIDHDETDTNQAERDQETKA